MVREVSNWYYPTDPKSDPPETQFDEAAGYFQWLNSIIAHSAPKRPPLIINMDETALVRHVTGLQGTVVKVSAPKQAAIERASLADRRSYISYSSSPLRQ